MHSRKQIAAILALLLALAGLCLCGCTDINGDIPGKREVERKVHEVCPTEPISLVQVDHEDSLPKKDTYHYQSQKRNLTFETVSTLSRISIDASQSNFFTKSITCDYVSAVVIFHKPQITGIMQASGLSVEDHGINKLVVSKWEDVETAVSTLVSLRDEYASEEAYNSKDWIRQNLNIPFTVVAPGLDGKMHGLGSYGGVDATESDMRHELQMQYARAVFEGKIADDPNIPSEVTSNVHVQHLDTILMKGVPMDDRMANRATGAEYNFGENVFTAEYDYEFQDYMVKIDVGITPIECGPHSLVAYIEWAGGTLNMDYDKGKGSWTVNGQKRSLVAAKDKSGHVASFKVMEGTTDMRIPWKQSPRETYMILVPANELARMLGMNAHVNEQAGVLFFD